MRGSPSPIRSEINLEFDIREWKVQFGDECLILPEMRCLLSSVVVVALLPVLPARVFAQVMSGDTRYPVIAHAVPNQRSLEFLPNRGQLADQCGKPMPEVLYSLDGHGVKFYFTKNSVHYVFSKSTQHDPISLSRGAARTVARQDSLSLYRIDVQFPGANPHVEVSGEDTASDYTNYYLAQCPNGITMVRGFRRIVYKELYPHIDLVFYTSDSGARGMEYDFIIHPGGDPNQLRMQFEGQDSLRLNAEGEVGIFSPFGTVTDRAPRSYQSGGHRVVSRYDLTENLLSFRVGEWDRASDLVIDPPRIWATYFGGNSDDRPGHITSDRHSNILLCGFTQSATQIATSGAHQTVYAGGGSEVFISKFDPSGTIVWSTYYGGTGQEGVGDIVTDSSSAIYLCGNTSSKTAMVTAGAFKTTFSGESSCFITKFDSAGSLVWGTYYGGDVGASTLGNTYATAIALDSNDDLVVAGDVVDSAGIATPGTFLTTRPQYAPDGFIAKFSTSGSRIWGTYYAYNANIESCAIDRNNNISIAGFTGVSSGIATAGTYHPTYTTNTGYQGFVARFTSAGQRAWGTYLYGDANESFMYGIGVDQTGVVNVAGQTDAMNGFGSPGAFQTTNGGLGDDIVLVKLDTTGNLIWSTFYGGYAWDWALGIVEDPFGNSYFCGGTNTAFGLASPNEYQTTSSGSTDCIIAKFDSSGRRKWATYYGGSGADQGYAITLDRQGHPIVAGVTESTSGIASPGAYQTTFGGTPYDCFVLKLCDTLRVTLHSSTGSEVCSGSPTTLTALDGYQSYQWQVDGSAIPGATSRSYIVSGSLAAGTHRFTVTAVDPGACANLSDTLILHVHSAPQLTVSDASICKGSSVQIGGVATTSAGPLQYHWTPSVGLDNPSKAEPIASPTVTTQYTVIVTDTVGCQTTKQVLVTVNPMPQVRAGKDTSLCQGSGVLIGSLASAGTAPYIYEWTPTTGLNRSDIATPYATPATTTTYHIRVTDSSGCQTTDSVTITIYPAPQIFAGNDTTICAGSSIVIGDLASAGTPPYSYEWSPAAGLSATNIARPIASPLKSTVYSVIVTDGHGCQASSQISVNLDITQAGIDGPNSACPNVTLQYSSRFVQGSQYHWSLSGGGSIVDGGGTSAIHVNWTTAGVWTVRLEVTSALGCVADTQFDVTIDTTLHPQISILNGPIVCAGDTAVLSASAGYDTYRWSNGATQPVIAITSSGDYAVHVTNAAGCAGTSGTIHVTVLTDSLPRPVILAATSMLCAGDSTILRTSQSYASYQWSTGDTAASLVVSKPGAYSVTVSNAAGCMGTSLPLTITVLDRPTVLVTASGPTTFCDGDSVMLSATPGYRYVWFKEGVRLDDTLSDIVVKTSGSYWITAINAAGCDTETAPIAITIRPIPQPIIVGPSAICINGTAGYRISSAVGSTTVWQIVPASIGTIVQGQGSDSITVQWAGRSTGTLLVAVSANGCQATATLPITVDTQLNPRLTANGPLAFCEGDSVTLDAGSGYASYQWTLNGTTIAGATGETLVVRSAGSYAAIVTNSASCSGFSSPSLVTVYATPPKPNITEVGSLLTSSAASSYEWSLNNNLVSGATNQSIQPPRAGLYRVLILDSNGCSNISDPFQYDDSGSTVVAVPPMTRANPGDRITLPLALTASANFALSGATHFEATIRFNNSLLASTGTTPLGTVQGADRLVSISGLSEVPLTASTGTIATVDLIDTCTPVTIDNFRWTDGRARVTTENGEFCLDGVCLAGGRPRLIDPNAHVSLSEIRPNPSSESVEIEYQIAEEGPTRIVLQDFLGRTALVVRDQWMTPGAYRESVSVSAIATGAYRVVLRTPSDILTRRMEVVK